VISLLRLHRRDLIVAVTSTGDVPAIPAGGATRRLD
jgi:hypothetical protein